MIHGLYEDFSKSLDNIEISVAESYPPEKINNLQNLLFEIQMQISLKITEQMDNSMIAKQVLTQLGKQWQNEMSVSDIQFDIL